MRRRNALRVASLPVRVVAVVLVATAHSLSAQMPAGKRPRGSIGGRVLSLDALPLPAAHVTLTATESSGVRSSRTTLTASDGSYHFGSVAAGLYVLRVRRIGYRPATIEITLPAEARVTVSPALVVAPVMMRPLEVNAARADPYARSTDRAEQGSERLAIERWRQDAFLTSDTRAVTHRDVVESITLGTSDALRALQRLPGVTTRDDWTSELWIRGASWGQARIYFDEMPLLNPVHGGGIISAINADALGALVLHPGVRSVRLGEGSAGVVNLASRAAAGDAELRGYGEMTLTGGGLTLERRFLDGRVGVLAGYRRSHLRVAASELEEGEFGILDFKIPDNYADLVGRIDLELGRGRRIEMSGLWQRDWVLGNLEGGPFRNKLAWGNATARATLDLPTPVGYSRTTVGFSVNDLDIVQRNVVSDLARFFDREPTQPETHGRVWYVTLKGETGSIVEDEPDGGWRAGYQLTHQGVSYDGAPAAPYPVQSIGGSLVQDDALTTAALWGEARWAPARHLTFQGGLRVEFGRIEPTGGLRLAPQISARYRVGERLSLTGGYGRTYQYLQAFAPAGLTVGPGLPVGYVWMLAGADSPALGTDMLSVGTEYWLDDGWLASITGYGRHATGLTLVDPTPGRHGARSDPVIGDNDAIGLDIGIRRLAGSWTTSIAYSLTASRLDAVGRRYPAPSDRRHAIDAISTWRTPLTLLGGRVTVGGAVTAMTGAPYTRFFPGTYECDEVAETCTAIVPDQVGEPNAARTPAYGSLDVMFDWTRAFSAWTMGWSLAIRNLTTRRNGITYDITRDSPCRRDSPDDPLCAPGTDAFEDWPSAQVLLGLRVEF